MLILPGPLTGQASGRLGGTVASHNRYGMYLRNGVIPVNPNTSFQQAQRAHLGAASTAWQGLTDAQRLAWTNWAGTNPVVNRLGQPVDLQGNAAYVQIAARLLRAGQTLPTLPPVTAQPDALLTLTGTFDIGSGSTEVTFTPTPLGAAEQLWLNAAVVDSSGINYVRNLLKNTTIATAATTSPYDWQADVEARFGTLSVGQKVVILGSVFDNSTGLLSTSQRVEGIVVST